MPSTRIGLGRLRLIEQGPTLDVQIEFDPEFRPSELARPNIPEVRLPALVDTGATESCIDSDLARVLQLPIVDRQAIAGVHGASETNVCLAQIHVPDLGFTMYGRFAVVHLAAGGLPHSALLGRNFLQHFTMTYEGKNGVVILSNE
jgi:predicted aspartyl protease